MEDGFRQALSLEADRAGAEEYHVAPAPMTFDRRSSRTTVALVAAIALLVGGAVSLAFVGRHTVGGSSVVAKAHVPMTPHHSVEIAAFVVPNSATENRRPNSFPALSSSLYSGASTPVRGAAGDRRARLGWAIDKPVTDVDVGGSMLSHRRLATAMPVAGSSFAGEPSAVAAPSATLAVAQKKSDCQPSFEFDEQGRRRFSSACVATRSGVATTGVGAPRPSPGCSPSFELDEQGRKHFKPECFLKGK